MFLHFFSSLRKMAVFSLKPRIFRAQGLNGVLWGQSEFLLDSIEGFYHVVGRRAALGDEYEGPVGTHYRCIIIALCLIIATACLQYLYNMQLWAVLLRISGFRRQLMHN